jgi:nickel-dependent lactate racemase
MVDVWLPYGKTDVCVRVPARNLLGSIEPKDTAGAADTNSEIERALKEPIGTKRLSEIAKPESKVAIVVDDTTGKPCEKMLLPVLRELGVAGVKDENITIIFGCGSHRAVKPEEAPQLVGDEAYKRVKIISHNANDPNLAYLGTTKTHDNKIYVNKMFAEADVKVLLGEVDFHYYAGYEGGRKSVLPGVCGTETIQNNHALQ